MTYQHDFTLSEALLEQQFLEQLTTDALEALPSLFQVLLNFSSVIQRRHADRAAKAFGSRSA